MNNRLRLIFVTLGVMAVVATALPMLAVWRAPKVLPPLPAVTSNTVVVDLRDDASAAGISKLETQYRIDLELNSLYADDENLMRATVPAGQDPATLAAQLRRDPQVEAAEQEVVFSVPERGMKRTKSKADAVPPSSATGIEPAAHGGFVPNDPRYPEQWNLRMIGAPAAWRRSRGEGVVVAVIDTGVAADSPRGHRAKDFSQTRFTAGYDFVHDDADPYDDNGHGTHVAGTIAESTNNREGVAGLAFAATVMPLKVLSAEGWGTSSDVADAIRYAADHGAHVINMSLGSALPSRVVADAVRYAARKGVVIVCAAGNGFGEGVGYPAAFPECIAVSAVGPSGDLALYSSYGQEVTLAAPGGDMLSGAQADGILQNTIFPTEQGGDGDDYYFFQGTSMATPHVAATAALLMAQGVRDPALVRDLLVRSVTLREPKLKYGAGILAAGTATAMAANQTRLRLLKWVVFALLAGWIFVWPRGLSFRRRVAFVAALWVGCFGPDRLAAWVGADTAWNLLGCSAFVPFMLFWEWEEGHGSRLVAVLALGVALGLTWNLMMATLPFTPTTFGNRALPWAVTNVAAALLLAALAWRRGQS